MQLKTLQQLQNKGLLVIKDYPELELRVLKYSRKVFYDALWEDHPELEECRGRVVDYSGKTIIRPFKKVYNYLERGTCHGTYSGLPVQLVQKLNGFMASATLHKGELLVATTGTLDSTFAFCARDWIKTGFFERIPVGYTALFEICDPDDPHIIEEEPGVYLIGLRHNESGHLVQEHVLDSLAEDLGYKRPYHLLATFGEALELQKTCKHEGYMIRNLHGVTMCKLKSKYYLSKKALMRMGKKNIEMMYRNPKQFRERLDEEFYELLDFILAEYTEDEWKLLKEQDRRRVIETFFEM